VAWRLREKHPEGPRRKRSLLLRMRGFWAGASFKEPVSGLFVREMCSAECDLGATNVTSMDRSSITIFFGLNGSPETCGDPSLCGDLPPRRRAGRPPAWGKGCAGRRACGPYDVHSGKHTWPHHILALGFRVPRLIEIAFRRSS